MEDFQIMFELSEHQISQIYEVLGKEDVLCGISLEWQCKV